MQLFDRAGGRAGSFGDGELHGASGFDVDGDEIFVCDTYDHEIKVFDLGGNPTRVIRGPRDNELNGPTAVAVDRQGNLQVVDSGSVRVCVFSRDGRLLRTYGKLGGDPGQMLAPRSVAIAADGRVFIADPAAGLVHVFGPQGKFLGRFVPLDARGEPAVPMRITRRHDGGMHIWTAGHEAAPNVTA